MENNINQKLQKQSIQTDLSGVEIRHLNLLLRERAEFAKSKPFISEDMANDSIEYLNNAIKKLLNL
jgi:hypothetical protein